MGARSDRERDIERLLHQYVGTIWPAISRRDIDARVANLSETDHAEMNKDVQFANDSLLAPPANAAGESGGSTVTPRRIVKLATSSRPLIGLCAIGVMSVAVLIAYLGVTGQTIAQ